MQGTQTNPIILDLNEPEHDQDIEHQLELARRKQLLDEAKLSRNGIELALAVIKTTIKGQLKLKNKTLNRAIIRYFQDRIGMNVSCQHFHTRKEPNYENNPINPSQFLLYGVDFLTTAMIQDRFKLVDTTLQQIKWISSSSCKLIFKTESEAKMVLQSQVIDKKTLQFKFDEQSGNHLQGWFTLKPYHFLNFQRQLTMRYTTQNQNQKEEMNKYKDYETAYAELLPYLFEQFKAFTAYEQVIKEIEREKLEQINNRHEYRRNRRIRNFGHHQDPRERMDRSRTRDNKYKNQNHVRRNQNFYQRDKNTSFQYNNSRVSNNQGYSKDINTSFQMIERNHRFKADHNISNTSFQMQPYNQNNNQNREISKWQRNNNRSNKNDNPNQFQARVVHQTVYQHRPVDQKQMRTYNISNSRQLKPPRKKNVYYDCNGIDDQDNLSYQIRSFVNENNEESDDLQLVNQNFNVHSRNKANHNKSNQIQKQDLSFLINSLNNSKEDYVLKKTDESFIVNKQTNEQVLNKNLNNYSFEIDQSKMPNRQEEEKQKIDFNQLFHLQQQEDISPIHINNNDTSFVMKEPQRSKNYSNKNNQESFLDFKKPNKKHEQLWSQEDGY